MLKNRKDIKDLLRANPPRGIRSEIEPHYRTWKMMQVLYKINLATAMDAYVAMQVLGKRLPMGISFSMIEAEFKNDD